MFETSLQSWKCWVLKELKSFKNSHIYGVNNFSLDISVILYMKHIRSRPVSSGWIGGSVDTLRPELGILNSVTLICIIIPNEQIFILKYSKLFLKKLTVNITAMPCLWEGFWELYHKWSHGGRCQARWSVHISKHKLSISWANPTYIFMCLFFAYSWS